MHSVGNLETKAYVELGVKSENIFEIAPAISRENFVKNRIKI